jgi:hypothetical protein
MRLADVHLHKWNFGRFAACVDGCGSEFSSLGRAIRCSSDEITSSDDSKFAAVQLDALPVRVCEVLGFHAVIDGLRTLLRASAETGNPVHWGG